MYEWGYIVDSTLAKLGLTMEEAESMNMLNNMYIYANEALTQICSTIKPKKEYYTINTYRDAVLKGGVLYVDGLEYSDLVLHDDGTIVNSNKEIVFNKVNTIINIDDPLFVSFNDDISTLTYEDDWGESCTEETHDDVLLYKGYHSVVCKEIGTYHISYNKKWLRFLPKMRHDDTLDAPDDVLECIPSYIASQLYKLDDEYKSSVYRNEYEMFLARIDNTDYNTTSTFKIQGDW